MTPGSTGQIVLLMLLLLISAFFSASETALMSLSKIRIRHMVKEGVKNAALVDSLVENQNRLLGAILVGNNLVNIGASALATSLALQEFGSAGIGLATGAMTLLVLIFGEITPKSLATQKAEVFSLKVAPILSVLAKLLGPVLYLLLLFTNRLVKAFGGQVRTDQPLLTEDELRTLVQVSHEEGVLEGDERVMIDNVFNFGDTRVKEVMTPRVDMVAIEDVLSYEKILQVFKKEHFSRLPVYHDTIDQVVGILSLKDLVFSENPRETFCVKDLMRPAFFTHAYKRTAELFEDMRSEKIPLALVLDEYGGTAGLVTLEDLVEEIVGELEDEFDEPTEEIKVIREDEYLVLGTTRIQTLNDLIGIHLETDEFDSIGGFAVSLFGKIPSQGDTLTAYGMQLQVEKMDRNRIALLRIKT